MKQIKKVKTREEKETGIRDEIRGLGVVIEHVDSKVSLIAEQYGDIKNALDEHTRILSDHTEMIGSIKMDIEVIKADVAFIKGGLKQKVDAEEFLLLERRVALLEKRR